MIDILETEGYSLEDFKNLLVAELADNKKLKIVVPKSTQQFFSSSENIAIDYLALATVGQILHDASSDFIYEEIAPTIHENVTFEVIPKNVDDFSVVLMEVSFFFNDITDDDYDDLFVPEKIEEFREFAENNEIACPYFYEVYGEFSDEVNKQ